MPDLKEYKDHYILYGANETPSGFWQVSVTIGDDDAEKTARTLLIQKKFTSEKEALKNALAYGKDAINKLIKGNKPDYKSI